MAAISRAQTAAAVVCWASRFGTEHDTDIVIVLAASKPVSAGFISDLKRVTNEAHADNLNVGV